MANPFKEAEKAKKKAPGSKQQEVVEKKEAPQQEAEPVVEKVEEKKAEQPANRGEAKPKPAAREKTVSKDIFASLTAEKPTGKTYAFYLSDENVAKLKKMAEKKGISASKLLDHILSEIL